MTSSSGSGGSTEFLSENGMLPFPENDAILEQLSRDLFRKLLDAPTCDRLGSYKGKAQFGLDLLAQSGQRTYGIQCKCYTTTKLTVATIQSHVDQVDNSGIALDEYIIVLTKPYDAKLFQATQHINAARKARGCFPITLKFWDAMSEDLRAHPDIARKYIPGFKDSIQNLTLRILQEGQAEHAEFSQELAQLKSMFLSFVSSLDQSAMLVNADGNETDQRVVSILDQVKALLGVAKTDDAQLLLQALGEPEKLVDKQSRFRSIIYQALIWLLQGNSQSATEQFKKAYVLDRNHEKAIANYVMALVIGEKYELACNEAQLGLRQHPNSVPIWTYYLLARFKNGEPNYQEDLPEDIKNKPDILFSLAKIASWRDAFNEALGLLDQCETGEEGKTEQSVQRERLSVALAWASVDPYLCLKGAISVAQRSSLERAIAQLEPLEETLRHIQSPVIFEELTNNIVYSLLILEQKERAYAINLHALHRYPEAEGLVRVRIQELTEKKDFEAIKRLTEHRLGTLTSLVLAPLLDMAANTADMSWFLRVQEVYKTHPLTPQQLQVLETVKFAVTWNVHQSKETIDQADTALQNNLENLSLRTLQAHMLTATQRRADAIELCQQAFDQPWQVQPSYARIQFARMLARLGQFGEAATVFQTLVDAENGEPFYEYLHALLRSRQRKKFLDGFTRLPVAVQNQNRFTNLLAECHAELGDWHAVRTLLTNHDGISQSCSMALMYAASLHWLGAHEELKEFLATDHRFPGSYDKHEVEFAKLQMHHGHPELALLRVYRLYKQDANNATLAGYFLILAMQQKNDIPTSDVVGPGVVVTCQSEKGTTQFLFDPDADRASAWPEIAHAQSALGQSLLGMSLGGEYHQVTFGQGISWKITRIDHWSFFVAAKAQELISNSVEPGIPITSMPAYTLDGQVNVDQLLAMARSRRAYVNQQFENYSTNMYPLSTLSRVLGTDLDTLIREWPINERLLSVNFGTREARIHSFEILKTGGMRFVFDYTALHELARLELLETLLPLLGKPIVATSTVGYLKRRLHILKDLQPKGYCSEVNGQLAFAEYDPSFHEQNITFIRSILESIEKYCEVRSAIGPENISPDLQKLYQIVDGETFDTLYLAHETNVVLVTLDAHLRHWCSGINDIVSIEFQSLLGYANIQRLFSYRRYCEFLVDQISRNYGFVAISEQELFALAKIDPFKPSDKVRALLGTFRYPGLEIISALDVSCAFVVYAMWQLPPEISGKYIQMVLDSLKHDRMAIAEAINDWVLLAVESGLKLRSRHLPN